MPKAFVTVKDAQLEDDGSVRLIYTVVMHGARPDDDRTVYGCDYTIDPTLSMDENNEALKEKVMDAAVFRGYRMSKGDVIPHGLPTAKDAQSFTDKTNGITSDRSAVAKDPVKEADAPPGLMARMVENVKAWWG